MTDIDDQKPKKPASQFKIKDMDPAVVEAMKQDYITGNFTCLDISRKYKISRPVVYIIKKRDGWKAIMDGNGIKTPIEPRPFDMLHSPQEWDEIERLYLNNISIPEISRRYNISKCWLYEKSKKRKWNIYRDQLVENRRKRLVNSVSSRMAEFDEMSAEFINQATVQIKRMVSEITIRNMVAPERLEKLMKMHLNLYELVKKIPVKPEEDSSHEANQPAPVLGVVSELDMLNKQA